MEVESGSSEKPVEIEDDKQDEEEFLIQKPAKKRAQKRSLMDVDENKASTSSTTVPETSQKRPNFAPISESSEAAASKDPNAAKPEIRRIVVPRHRYAPLKASWLKLIAPIVEQLKLQVRFNLKTRCVELRASPEAKESGSLQKAADFMNAFIVGFSVEDALALIRLDDLYVDSFEIEDVKPLKGEHLIRAIGRVAGHNGKTKYTIENATRTRIVLADNKIHLLGSYANIALARRAICSLIMGSPPSKVYGTLRGVAQRAVERF